MGRIDEDRRSWCIVLTCGIYNILSSESIVRVHGSFFHSGAVFEMFFDIRIPCEESR